MNSNARDINDAGDTLLGQGSAELSTTQSIAGCILAVAVMQGSRGSRVSVYLGLFGEGEHLDGCFQAFDIVALEWNQQ